MPKVTDIKAYWREIATKAGLGEDELKQVSSVIDNDKFAKAFTDSFKPLPDYSHDLDQVRARTKEEKDAEYADWFGKENQKYEQYVAGLQELEAYRKGQRPPGQNGEGNTMTQQQIDQLVEAKLNASLESVLGRRDQAFLAFRDADFDHMKRFSKPMDRLAFEKAWKDNPQWGGDLFVAYERWVQPEVEKARETEWQAKIEARYQEGLRDGSSRRSLPTDHASKSFSPMFDRKDDVAKLDERAQEDHSRNAFFEGLREK